MKTCSIGLALLLAGCAPTAHERFGDVARFAPRFGAYVVGPEDRPFVLRDPITTDKLRCRDDVARAAPALRAVLDDAARDQHADAVAPLALAPLTGAGLAVELLGVGLWYPAAALGEGVAAPQPRRLYIDAREAFIAGRYRAAREGFLVVVIRRGLSDASFDNLPQTFVDHALYYLALSDEALGRHDEAIAALERFLETASGEDEARYRDAELRLARLEGRTRPCASRAEVNLAGGTPR